MIKREINELVENNPIEIEEIENSICLKIRKIISELYADEKKKGLWLWEKLSHYDSISDKDGWSYIKEFVSDNDCILFFNEFDEINMYKIKNGNDLYFLLSETSGFEFYITDLSCSYLICFSHHDILYGCGTAIDWIVGLKKGTL
jgi:hypothetical protein